MILTVFTPGPWIEAGPGLNGKMIHIDSVVTDRDDPGDLGDDICILPPYNDEETNVANARLIAAAPDMYAALSKIQFLFACDDEGLAQPTPAQWLEASKMIDAAIAKAEGKDA